MDVTMGNRMEMTMARMDRTMEESNPVQVGNKTTLGGGMDITIAPSTCEKMEMSMGRVEPASSLSKTVVGGGMDITMDNITALNSTGKGLISEEGTVINGDSTRHGRGMEATLMSNQTDLLPDSLPNSNNSSFDGGATATVKFSQLALANNTLMLPRKESEEEDEEEDFTRAPEQVFSYDPCQVISVEAPPLATPVARATSILKKVANDGHTLPLEEGAKVDDNAMEMSKVHNTVQGEDMEMTMGGGENPRTRLNHDVSRTRETKIPKKTQSWNRTTVQGQDMEMTRAGGEAIMEDTCGGGNVAAGQRERSPQRTQPWNKTSIQGEDMEMTRAGAKHLGDRTSGNQENMEMTKIAPQITIQGRSLVHQDDMEMTRAGKGSDVHILPSISPRQEEAVAQAEESGWETMHSPIISVSPLLSIQPSKAKSQGELLRENFPSPVASPSPEMTRMLSGMPGKPKSKAGIWDGEVTSFMPVGESTRAIKIRLPPVASTISPACSPVSKPVGKMEVGDLTSFAPGEEYESTRKLPARSSQLPRQEFASLGARPKSSLKSPSVSPLPSVAPQQVGDLTTFSPMEDYESTRKLPVAKLKVPLQPHSPCVSTVEEEVTSPNRGARIQETMLPGLEVTAAPGCFCFTSHRGGGGGDESRMRCTVHMNATTGGEERQMGNSLAQEVKTRSPPQKRSSGEFDEELAKRQRRLGVQTEEDQTEGEEEAGLEEKDEEGEGKESPEK